MVESIKRYAVHTDHDLVGLTAIADTVDHELDRAFVDAQE